MHAVLLQEDDREQHDLALGREGADNLDDAVEFDLVLRLPDVFLGDDLSLRALGEFARSTE